MPEFAVHLGYRSTDTLYRQMRGDYVPPVRPAQKMAKLLGWTTGRFIDECEKFVTASRRRRGRNGRAA